MTIAQGIKLFLGGTGQYSRFNLSFGLYVKFFKATGAFTLYAKAPPAGDRCHGFARSSSAMVDSLLYWVFNPSDVKTVSREERRRRCQAQRFFR